jgi:hypothetical protein
MNKLFSVLLLCFLFLSCTTTKLKPGASKIKIGKQDPDPKCEELGTVSGFGGFSKDVARNQMRNEDLKKSGNYVRFDMVKWDQRIGTAFRCP